MIVSTKKIGAVTVCHGKLGGIINNYLLQDHFWCIFQDCTTSSLLHTGGGGGGGGA